MSPALTFVCAAFVLHLLLGGSDPGPWRWVALPLTLVGATTVAVTPGVLS